MRFIYYLHKVICFGLKMKIPRDASLRRRHSEPSVYSVYFNTIRDTWVAAPTQETGAKLPLSVNLRNRSEDKMASLFQDKGLQGALNHTLQQIGRLTGLTVHTGVIELLQKSNVRWTHTDSELTSLKCAAGRQRNAGTGR